MCKRIRFAQRYSLEELVILCYYVNLLRLFKPNHRYRIIYSLRLENGVTMTPKRRLLTLIFACLCFKKSLLINNNTVFCTLHLMSDTFGTYRIF